MNKNKLLDALLLPQSLYLRLTDRRRILYAGILLVGILDVIFLYISKVSTLFAGKPGNVLFINVVLALVIAVLIGIMDVVFFSVPVFDVFKLFRREDAALKSRSFLIRVMKIYIIANLLVVPGHILYFILFHGVNLDARIDLQNSAVFLDMLIFLWYTAAITRGICASYKFQFVQKSMVFLIVYLWNFLLSGCLEYMMNNWFLKLFM